MRPLAAIRDALGAKWDERAERRRRAAASSRFYSQLVEPGALVFDVGANVGAWSRMFLGIGARVVAVEPQPRCIAQLNRVRGLIVEPVAVGSSVGRGEMRVASASTISSMSDAWIASVRTSGRFSEFDWAEPIEVDVLTLDRLIDRHGRPDYCKIDVEGFEPEVVAGLSQRLPLLSFEFTPECRSAADAVLERLIELGFERFALTNGETFTFLEPGWVAIDEFRPILDALSPPADFGDIFAA